jgi:rhodanese-related sulfurtransferase
VDTLSDPGWDRLDVTPREVRRRLDDGEALVFVDVREPFELAFATIPGAVHVPLLRIAAEMPSLPSDCALVLFCHHGVRSAWATRQLRRLGRRDVFNLAGGIEAWSREVDSSVPRY